MAVDNPLTTDVGASLVRTIAPYVTAFVVAKLAKIGLVANSDDVQAQVIVIGGTLWYAVVRAIETKVPQAGWLLGMPKAPTYESGH